MVYFYFVLANIIFKHDGADADSGTCWKCGYAVAKGKPVILLRTDFRVSGDTGGFNAMLYFSAAAIIDDRESYLEKIAAAIESVGNLKD